MIVLWVVRTRIVVKVATASLFLQEPPREVHTVLVVEVCALRCLTLIPVLILTLIRNRFRWVENAILLKERYAHHPANVSVLVGQVLRAHA